MFDTPNSTVTAFLHSTLAGNVLLNQFTAPLRGADSSLNSWQTIQQQLTISNAWKLLLIVHIIINFKSFPFIYHLRILNAVRFVLHSQRPKIDVKPEQLFQPLITSSRACLAEIDVYGHKSNSTYFADIDIARAHLVTTLFGKGISRIRGGTTMNGLSGQKSSKFTMALGAVSCSFKRELRPYEAYDMWTRILSWDEKWIYIVTHFVKKDAKITPKKYTLYPRQGSLVSGFGSRKTSAGDTSTAMAEPSPIVASALSKIVFKEARKTIPPTHILGLSGLLGEDGEISVRSSQDGKSPSPDAETLQEQPVGAWTSARIEPERLRGLRIAELLAKQTDLVDEFRDEVALGRHYDGYGIEGVVSTLAQLGRISNYQLL